MGRDLTPALNDIFGEIAQLISESRTRAVRAVNTEIIQLHWEIGRILSEKTQAEKWGAKVISDLASYLKRAHPKLTGFSRPNLIRMRQFYEVYVGDPIGSPLVNQLPWSHNLLIMLQAKRPEERHFYLQAATKEKWSKRELERQLKGALFERRILSPAKLAPAVRDFRPEALAAFKDSYLVEFLDLPTSHSESDLHQGLIQNLRKFLTELGRDFCFIGSEHPIQVGQQDFALDLLFFHRELNCLVAIELKVGRFEPEHLGKLNFYLEALDRDIKKEHENPSIGLLLCASKDDEVVEKHRRPVGVLDRAGSARRVSRRGGACESICPEPLAFSVSHRPLRNETPGKEIAAGKAARIFRNEPRVRYKRERHSS